MSKVWFGSFAKTIAKIKTYILYMFTSIRSFLGVFDAIPRLVWAGPPTTLGVLLWFQVVLLLVQSKGVSHPCTLRFLFWFARLLQHPFVFGVFGILVAPTFKGWPLSQPGSVSPAPACPFRGTIFRQSRKHNGKTPRLSAICHRKHWILQGVPFMRLGPRDLVVMKHRVAWWVQSSMCSCVDKMHCVQTCFIDQRVAT